MNHKRIIQGTLSFMNRSNTVVNLIATYSLIILGWAIPIGNLLSQPSPTTSPDDLLIRAIRNNYIAQVRSTLSNGANGNGADPDGKPILFHAIDRNSKPILDELIKHNVDLNLRDPEGVPALLYSVRTNKAIAMNAILSGDVDPNLTDSSGRTPLMEAVSAGRNQAVVNALIAKGANPNSSWEDGNPLIILAITRAHSTLVKPFLDAGVSVNTRSLDGKPLLLIAHEGYLSRVNETRFSILKTLLDEKADPNTRTTSGITLLQDYVSRGMDSPIRLLLSKGADSSVVDSNKNQLIHLAATQGKVSTMNLILPSASSINARGDNGNTPLLMATQGNHAQAVNLLLQRGADPNQTNDKGESALTIAISNQNLTIARTLIQNKSNLNITNNYGNPLIMEMCSVDPFNMNASTFQLMDLLIGGGADINGFNEYGNNCLAYAINRKNTKMMEYLLKKGADPNAQDSGGRAALHKAVKAAAFDRLKNDQLTEIFSILLGYGGDPNLRDREGRTALHHAAIQENNRDVTACIQAIRILLDYSADHSIRDNTGKTAMDIAGSNRLFRDALGSKSNIPNLTSISSDSVLDLAQSGRGEIFTIEGGTSGKKVKIYNPRGQLSSEFPIEDGDSLDVDPEGNLWVLGRALGEINGRVDNRCKKDRNYVITLRKYNRRGDISFQLTEGRVTACDKSIPLKIRFNPVDNTVYLGVLFLANERNLYRWNEESGLVRIARPTGVWDEFSFNAMGNLVFLQNRYLELDREGKTVQSINPRSMSGRRGFSLNPEMDFFYMGIESSPKLGANLWVTRHKGNGSAIWTRRFGSSGTEEGLQIWNDVDSGVYFLGSSTGNFHGTGLKPEGTFFLTKLNSDGERVYTIPLPFERNSKETIRHDPGFSLVIWKRDENRFLILSN